MEHRIEFAKSVKAHFEVLTAAQRSIVFSAIERELTSEPVRETRNRKPLRPNPVAPWELRVGQLRVFYEVSTGRPAIVRVLAVGIKTRESLWIGGEEIKL